MEIYIAHTQGFCAGVSRAIKIVDEALRRYGTPLYVFHEIVHNQKVVRDFKDRGVQFVDDLDEVPDGARLIFSAHGVAPSTIAKAKMKHLHIVDATCPLVDRVHRQAEDFSKKKINVVLIGHKNHQEVIGTQGYVDHKLFHIVETQNDIDSLTIDPSSDVGYVAQTTLSLDDTKSIVQKLKEKFPRLIKHKATNICYATQNRQDAIKQLCEICDVILVCGSANSSNSNRLKETAQSHGVKSFLIDSAQDLQREMLNDASRVGVSSGASVPSSIVEHVIEKIKSMYPVENIHCSPSPEKEIIFQLPTM